MLLRLPTPSWLTSHWSERSTCVTAAAQSCSSRAALRASLSSGVRPHYALMHDYPLVSPKFEREPDNAPGPFYVIKDQCVLCALPPALAPANITWSQETLQRRCGETCPTHCRVEKQPETADELALVIEAARCSCIAAIRYCGTDPEILARFRAEGLESLCDAL